MKHYFHHFFELSLQSKGSAWSIYYLVTFTVVKGCKCIFCMLYIFNETFFTLAKSLLMLYVSGTEHIGKSGMKYVRNQGNVFLVREQRYTSLVTLKSFCKIDFFCQCNQNKSDHNIKQNLTCSPGHWIITEKAKLRRGNVQSIETPVHKGFFLRSAWVLHWGLLKTHM